MNIAHYESGNTPLAKATIENARIFLLTQLSDVVLDALAYPEGIKPSLLKRREQLALQNSDVEACVRILDISLQELVTSVYHKTLVKRF